MLYFVKNVFYGSFRNDLSVCTFTYRGKIIFIGIFLHLAKMNYLKFDAVFHEMNLLARQE